MPILEVKHLSKRFGSQQVLNDVSFTLEQGQVLALIGASGGGKSTLLRCLNFLETPDDGEIWVNGKCLKNGTEAEIRKNRLHFGLVFQNFNLFPQYTVLENVTLAPGLLGMGDGDTVRRHALALLERVGLSRKADQYPWQLSGGQQQRTAIARALALRPDILCFDEPTSALDPELTGEVLRVIRELKNSGNTMILVTHEMEFAKTAADVVIYMSEGAVEESGTQEQIFDYPRSEKLRAFLRGMQEAYYEAAFMNQTAKQEKIAQLYALLAATDDPQDLQALFDDLCTVKEIENMAERLHAAKLLMEGNTYNQVMAQADISSATLSRVSRCVQYGRGYSRLLRGK